MAENQTTAKFDDHAATLRAINSARASAAAVTAGSGPAHGSASSTSSSAGNTATGGGNGGNTHPPANGGGGSGSGKWFKSSTLLTLASVVATFAVIYFSVWKTTERGVALERENNQLEAKKLEIEQQKTLIAAGVMPPGYQALNRAPANPGDTSLQLPATTVVKQKIAVNGNTIPCNSSDEVDRAYESITTLDVNANSQSLQIGQGCASFRVQGNFSQFRGSNYIFNIAEKDVIPNGRQGYFYKCGDISGSHDSEINCLGMLNKYANFPVFVFIQNGGSITLD